jgi:hypothetical protein
MPDTGKYIIDEPYVQHRNDYNQLGGEWLTYYKVAVKFCHKVKSEDTDDILHTIMLNLAVSGRNNGHKPDNPSWMYRIASFTVAQYWRDYYRRTNGIDCGHCLNQQRKRCKADNLYSECPKAVRIESLQKPIVGDDGEMSEFGQLIADDSALDLDEWSDINIFLRGCPQRLVEIAEKRQEGIPLTKYEQLYLCRFWKKHQKGF